MMIEPWNSLTSQLIERMEDTMLLGLGNVSILIFQKILMLL